MTRFVSCILLTVFVVLTRAQSAKQGATLLKTDIMAVFAHPDDETGMAATLAYYAHARKATIANIYCTRGEGGGNMVGTQWGASLGVLRELELRDCLATLGVRSCYFLDQLDWAYTESAAATLAKWGKEETLERLVRLVRALRPEVILTMNPAPTPGQHGHHQSAGILATEAFSAAADPNRFPLQLSREGLTVWQPRRLFYGGAATNQVAAAIVVSEPLTDGQTPAEIAGRAMANHRSQGFGNFAGATWLQRPQRFVLVKAFVPNDQTFDDLLAGLPVGDSMLRSFRFAREPERRELAIHFKPRPAFVSYQRWLAEEKIEHVAAQFRADLSFVAGRSNGIFVELRNDGIAEAEGKLQIRSVEGWEIEAPGETCRLAAGTAREVRVQVTPAIDANGDQELTAEFVVGGQSAARSVLVMHPVPLARATRLEGPPAWDRIAPLTINPAQIVQGKVADEQDSSAEVRVAHNGRILFVDVRVKDDRVVTNIAPNDIRGHWRSDSVEICLDPQIGAEHTRGCYKVGIFPFDSTGAVRAARDADANQGPIEETAPGTRIASERLPDGYRVSAAIPFTEIGLKEGQKELGFNVIVYDGDKENAAPGENINKSRIAWAPRSGVQGRPEDWGRLVLE